MKKTAQSKKNSSKKKSTSETKTLRGLFDHLNQIRTIKDPGYYESLCESERKSFNHWLLLDWLSMDENLVPKVAVLWQDGYYDKIPSEQFYKLLIGYIPYTEKRLFYVRKPKRNKKLLECMSTWYSISDRESQEYINIFAATEDGCKKLVDIIQGLGFSEGDTQLILEGKYEE